MRSCRVGKRSTCGRLMPRSTWSDSPVTVAFPHFSRPTKTAPGRQSERKRLLSFRPPIGPADDGDSSALDAIKEGVRMLKEDSIQLPLRPFHWEVEFPEVFGGGRDGFDAIVGNPPFAGKNTLIASNRDRYPDWLKTMHA